MEELAKKTFENHPGLDAVLVTADRQVFNAEKHRNAAYAHAASNNQPEPTLFTRIEVFGTPAEPVAETPAEPVAEAPAEPVTETPAEPVTETPAEPVTGTPAEPVAETPAEPVTGTPAEPVAETPGTTTDAGNTTEPGKKGKKN